MSQHLKDDLKVIMLEQRAPCEVCGRRMHVKLLRSWNGKKVCGPCIRGLNEEAERAGGDLNGQ